MNEIYHHGIKGQKWGKRNGPPYPLNPSTSNAVKKQSNGFEYAKESNKTIKINQDGSRTIPTGFVFNRVGKSSLDVNQSGGLYVSYGKEDAARYVKSLGPTLMGKLLGTAGESIQHISVKKSLKMPSDSETATEIAKLLLSDKKLFDRFSKSFYSVAVTGQLDKNVTEKDIEKALKNPSGKEGQKLAYGVSSFLGDTNYVEESKTIYQHFRSKGYDVIPDIRDRLSGTSTTAMIVVNPDKVTVTSTTKITKDVMKSGKSYVKSLEKLKVSDLIK